MEKEELFAAGGIDISRLWDDQIKGHFLAVAVNLDGNRVARRLLRFKRVQFISGLDILARKADDNVALLQTRTLSGTHRRYIRDIHADRHGILLAHVLRDVLDGDAQHNLAALGLILDGIRIVNHLLNEFLDVVDRNGIADALDAHRRALGIDHADDVAVGVKQRTAGVAGVNRRIRLDGVDGHIVNGQLLLDGGDDARGHGAVNLAHRVADGNRQLANLELIAVAEHGGIQTLRVDFQNRDIVVLRAADERRLIGLLLRVIFAGVDIDRDFVRAGDNVVVGQNVAVFRNDDAGAGSRFGVFLRAAATAASAIAVTVAIAEHAAERIVVIIIVVVDHLGLRFDGDNGRAALLGNLRNGERIFIGSRLNDAEMLIAGFRLRHDGETRRRRQRQCRGQSDERTNILFHFKISFRGNKL